MGYSTPKKPFDLGEFLSQKATTRSIRKPTWQRRAAGAATARPDETADEADEAAPEPAPRPKEE